MVAEDTAERDKQNTHPACLGGETVPLPYFPFYPGDWLSSTKVRILTLEERAAYFEIMCHMWGFEGECYLPDDDTLLARIAGVTQERWMEMRQSLVDGPMAVLQTDGRRITNKRLLAEWNKASEKSAKAAQSARSRYGKPADSEGDGNAQRTQSERNADAERANNERTAISDLRSQISEKRSEAEEDPPTGGAETPEVQIPEGWSQLHRFLNDHLSREANSRTVLEEVLEWANKLGCALVQRAIKESVDHGAHNWAYARSCLTNWQEAGVTTSEGVDALIAQRRRTRERTTRGPRRPANVIVRDDLRHDDAYYEQFIKKFPPSESEKDPKT